MLIKIYLIILIYFIIGFTCGIVISRKKEACFKKAFWIKFIFYFIIINLTFACIVLNPIYFHILSIFIILAGCIELIRIFLNSGFNHKLFLIISIIIFSIVSVGFYLFGLIKMELILYTFLLISTFDSSSQISGQLFGKRKMFAVISPNKTFEGFIGGLIGSLVVAYLLSNFINVDRIASVFYGAGIILSAFAGDLAASFFKRKFKVKDFSNALPGQGGFLDRFDSLFTGGSFMYLLTLTTL